MARRSSINLESLPAEVPGSGLADKSLDVARAADSTQSQGVAAVGGLPERRQRARTSEAARIGDAAIAQIDQLSKLATLGEVTALIAHELNNLLTPLLAYAQAGLDARDDPTFREKALAKCLVHAEQATRVSQAILGLAKHDGGSVKGNPGTDRGSCRAAAAVEAALSTISRDLSKDGIELNLDWKDDVEVAMPQAELQQVLLNLILNARRALLDAPERKLTIKIRRREKPADEGSVAVMSGSEDGEGSSSPSPTQSWVVIKVIDSGRGMGVGALLAAMGPRAYVRKRDTERGLAEVALRSAWTKGAWGTGRDGEPESGGGGLGLVLCRRLIEATGGTLWASSRQSGGTTIAAIVPGRPASFK